MLVFQPSLSTICAVGPELFMAWADTRYWPSGDQDRRRTWVVPPHCDKNRKKWELNQGRWHVTDLTEIHKWSSVQWELVSSGNRTFTQRATVLLFTSLKGLVMLASICQSTVLHTLRLWSSAWDAMYFPTGSHVSPFTKPVCPRRHVTISGKNRVAEPIRTPFLY